MTRPDTAPLAVRPAGPDDFDPWFALFDEVAAEGRWMGAEAPLDRDQRRAVFDRLLDADGTDGTDGTAGLYLAEADRRLVGAVSVTLSPGGVADLGMFVAGDRRGTGVGGALVETALAWARERGAHKVSLAVWPHNHAARGLYAKYGFVTEGRRRRHYRRRSGELWDAVIMGLVLDEETPGGPGTTPGPRAPIAFPADGVRGEGVVLRPWRAGDAPALMAEVDDPEIQRWLDPIPHPYTADDAAEYISGGRQGFTEGREARLAITGAGDGRILGSVGLHLGSAPTGEAEIGYWVAATARGKGVATTAARLLSEWALGDLGLRRVQLHAALGNVASRRVAERAGFELEGISRAWRTVQGEPADFAVYSRVATPRTTRSDGPT